MKRRILPIITSLLSAIAAVVVLVATVTTTAHAQSIPITNYDFDTSITDWTGGAAWASVGAGAGNGGAGDVTDTGTYLRQVIAVPVGTYQLTFYTTGNLPTTAVSYDGILVEYQNALYLDTVTISSENSSCSTPDANGFRQCQHIITKSNDGDLVLTMRWSVFDLISIVSYTDPTATPIPPTSTATPPPSPTSAPPPTATPAPSVFTHHIENGNVSGSGTTYGGHENGTCDDLTVSISLPWPYQGWAYCHGVTVAPKPENTLGAIWDTTVTTNGASQGEDGLAMSASYVTGVHASVHITKTGETETKRYCLWTDEAAGHEQELYEYYNCQNPVGAWSSNSGVWDQEDASEWGIYDRVGDISATLDTFYWIVEGEGSSPPSPTSGYGSMCVLETISGTETITATINANLLTNGSFEDGLTGWPTGTGEYSVENADGWASDGSQVLYLPGTGASSICQPFTVPTSTMSIDHFSGGFDTDAGFLGTGMRNVNLIFSSGGITYQVANGFVYPLDDGWTVNSAGQNLPVGATGQLCITADTGDVSAYVDRVYIHARDTLSGVVCIAPSATITTTPTPTPTPSPSPTPTPPPPDNFPVPEIGGDGACYNCVTPLNILDFGQWIRWLLCGLNNLFYCYLYVWLLSLAGYASAGLQYATALFDWMTVSLNGLAAWLTASLNGLAAFMVDMLNGLAAWLTAGLEAMAAHLVDMLEATSRVIVSVLNDLSWWMTVSLGNLADWLTAVIAGLTIFFDSMKSAIVNWVNSEWPKVTGYLWGTFLGWMDWIQATTNTITNWLESGFYWLYSLLAGAVNTAVNGVIAMLSGLLSSLIASGAMLAAYAAAAWELIALYFSMLQRIAAAVVDLLDIIWRMTTGVLTAFTTDEATSVELFGYDIDNMQQPNGINDASLFYWMVLGFMLADAAITSIPLMNVFIYTVMGLMSWGMILWTLRRGTKMLPIS